MDAFGLSKRPQVPDKQMQSTNKLIGILQEFFYINTLDGHREFPEQAGEGKFVQVASGYRSSKSFGK